MKSSLIGLTTNIFWYQELERVFRIGKQGSLHTTWNLDGWQYPLGKCSKREHVSSSLHVVMFDKLASAVAAACQPIQTAEMAQPNAVLAMSSKSTYWSLLRMAVTPNFKDKIEYIILCAPIDQSHT